MKYETLDRQSSFEFLRQRAMQLLDEGMENEAKELLAVIDEEQLRRIAEELHQAAPSGACTER